MELDIRVLFYVVLHIGRVEFANIVLGFAATNLHFEPKNISTCILVSMLLPICVAFRAREYIYVLAFFWIGNGRITQKYFDIIKFVGIMVHRSQFNFFIRQSSDVVCGSADRKHRRSQRSSPLLQRDHVGGKFDDASFSDVVFNLSTTIVGARIMALPETLKQLDGHCIGWNADR